MLSACALACLLNVACVDIFQACFVYNYDTDIFQKKQVFVLTSSTLFSPLVITHASCAKYVY